jgi:hypothetical protein
MNMPSLLALISLTAVSLGGCALNSTATETEATDDQVKVAAVSIAVTCTQKSQPEGANLEMTMLTSASAETGKPDGVEVELRNPTDNTEYDFFVYHTNVKLGTTTHARYELRDQKALNPKLSDGPTVIVIKGLDSGSLDNVSVTHTHTNKKTKVKTVYEFAKGECKKAV